MKKRNKKPAPPLSAPRPGPTLLEFWTALKAGASVAEASGAAAAPTPPAGPARHGAASSSPALGAPSAPAAAKRVGIAEAPAPGSFSSGGSSGSGGSGGGGYGLSLIDPDPASTERIRRIMRELCEKDAKRNKK